MMKSIRKWSRILHRDIGFFFIGVTLIYGISGIALNHINDWNPNYSVDVVEFTTDIDLSKNGNVESSIKELLEDIYDQDAYRKHYYPDDNRIKIFLDGGSTAEVDLNTGKGILEILSKRILFYEVNYLHYNPNAWWMWFSDAYAVALVLFAVTSLFMVKGWKGAWGRGGIYAVVGIIIPVLIYLLA